MIRSEELFMNKNLLITIPCTVRSSRKKGCLSLGYILPINFEQYSQYQVRDIKPKNNFYEIKKVHKINKALNFKKSFPEITGKGRYIDKKI